MATCTLDVFMLPDTRWPPKVLTVLDGRLCPLKIQDEKIGYSGVEFWIVNIDIQSPLMEVKLEEWLGEEDEVNVWMLEFLIVLSQISLSAPATVVGPHPSRT
ncbi:hypothetical protein FXO37_03979 [Capsicum annuum]|nr:hypothetical protein FXO37_03979 [Capsicum annuum]